MSFHQSSRQLARAARSIQRSQETQDLSSSLSQLSLHRARSYHATIPRLGLLNLTTKSTIKELKETTMTAEQRRAATAERSKPKDDEQTLTPAQRAKAVQQRVREQQKGEEKKQMEQQQKLGGLAPNSFFAPDEEKGPARAPEQYPEEEQEALEEQQQELGPGPFSTRRLRNMEVALNPRPNARARWQRRMVIRDIRHRGRLSKRMLLARTERSHLARSHFFKTSMKKLAPLARQIAGKSIDEAITQMRFSSKKAAIEVKAHLIAARNEAIVARGMGLPPTPTSQPTASTATTDPSITPPLPTQRPSGILLRKSAPNPTDMYVAEAWTNRGPYGREAEYRAKGRVNMLRPPYTGISILLKEEKTRSREKMEKEMKAIRRRIGKNMWTQLPDRPIVRQSQQLLW